MRISSSQRRASFRSLHERGCFVLPSSWDVGSARLLQHLGFPALATTSAGFGWSSGVPDYGAAQHKILEHLTSLCRATDVPVCADFESGFSTDPAGVATNVKNAIQTGVCGLSIEDRDLDGPPGKLFETCRAVERLRAARVAIDESGDGVLLIAQTEGIQIGASDTSAAIDRLVTFAAEGADCLCAPGMRDKADIAALVRAVAPKPVNVAITRPGMDARELADLGVRRVSVGDALARVAWRAVLVASREIKTGKFDALAAGLPSDQLNGIFATFTRPMGVSH